MRAIYLQIAVISLLVALALAGCGGNNSASSTPPVPTPTPTPTPSNTSITVKFSGGPPLAAAEQIGTGPWMATSLTGGQLALTIPAGTTNYGIALVCGTPSDNGEVIVQATVLDPTGYSVQCTSPSTATITGSVNATAIPNTASVLITGEGVFPVTVSGTSGPFTLTGVPTGTGDIAALAEDSSGNVLAVKIVRSQAIPGPINGGNPITFAAGDATTTQSVAVTDVPAGYTVGVVGTYVTANNTGITLSPNSSQATNQYAVVPASEAQAGDFYSFTAVAKQGSNLIEQTFLISTTAGPTNMTLPAPWSSTTVAPAEFPTFTFNYAGLSSQPAVGFVGVLEWIPMGATIGKSIRMFATANFQSGSTMTVPDLTSLPGFNAMAASGTVVTWIAAVYGGVEQPYVWFAQPQPPNGSLSYVSVVGTYTEP